VRAGLAALRSPDGEAPGLLAEAARALADLDMALHAAAARHVRGRLLGGTEGTAIAAEAENWMRERGIAQPARIAAVLVPS
jgi:hypothetical protein